MPPLAAAVLLTLGLQLAVVFLHPLQVVFNTTGLDPTEIALALGLPWLVLVAVELEKFLFRHGFIYQAS